MLMRKVEKQNKVERWSVEGSRIQSLIEVPREDLRSEDLSVNHKDFIGEDNSKQKKQQG